MASYAYEKRLPSCSVNRQLLKDVELFILKKAETLLGEKFNSSRYQIQIQDSLGTQTLGSIDEFHYSQFPNDTRAIILEHRFYGGPVFVLTVRFDLNPSYANLKVDLSGESPQQQALGISAELDHLLDSYRNKRSFFVPSAAVGATLVLVSFLLFTFGLAFTLGGLSGPPPKPVWLAKNSLDLGILLLGLGLLIVAYFNAPKFFPYTAFDTRQNETRQVMVKWLFLGLISFILFTVIGIYLRIKWLGF